MHYLAAFLLLLPLVLRAQDQPPYHRLGPWEAPVFGLASDPATGDIYAASYRLVFRLHAGDTAWECTNRLPTTIATMAIDRGRIFLACDSGTLYTGSVGESVSREPFSTDNVDMGYRPSHWFSSLVVDSAFIAMKGGDSKGLLWRRDTAAWSPIISNLPDLRVNDILSDRSALYIASTDGVLRSDNDGRNWHGPCGDLHRCVSVLATSGPNLYAAVTERDSVTLATTAAIYRSTNGGDTWKPFWSYPPGRAQWVAITSLLVIGDTILADLWITDSSNRYSSVLYYSSNGGGAWKEARSVDRDRQHLLLASRGSIYIGGQHGVATFNPVTGEIAPTGSGMIEQTIISLFAERSNLYASAGQLMHYSTTTQRWDTVPCRAWHAWDDRVLFADGLHITVLGESRLMHTTDGGKSWSRLAIFPSVPSAPDTVLLSASASSSGTIVYYTGAGTYVVDSTFHSHLLAHDSWNQLRSEGRDMRFRLGAIIGDEVYVRTVSGIYHTSIDGSGEWEHVTEFDSTHYNWNITGNGRHGMITAAPFRSNPDRNYRFYITNDGGLSWKPAPIIPSSPYLADVEWASDGSAIALEKDSLYVLQTGASLWRSLPAPHNEAMWSIKLVGDDLFIGTLGGGLYQLTLDELRRSLKRR